MAKQKREVEVGDKRFYYFKGIVKDEKSQEEKEKTIACVCIIKEGDVWHRGVSLCSIKDMFCRDKGRNISLGRAIKAARDSSYTAPIKRDEAKSLIHILPFPFFHKAYNNCGLTDREKKIIDKRKKENEVQ